MSQEELLALPPLPWLSSQGYPARGDASHTRAVSPSYLILSVCDLTQGHALPASKNDSNSGQADREDQPSTSSVRVPVTTHPKRSSCKGGLLLLLRCEMSGGADALGGSGRIWSDWDRVEVLYHLHGGVKWLTDTRESIPFGVTCPWTIYNAVTFPPKD